MTAFGPYHQKEVIDFTKLHEHGIFVVSGATGAGKTTIFDAITFALYDSGSGEDREKSLFLRSDFAEETVDTEVELEFEVHGRFTVFGGSLVMTVQVQSANFLRLRMESLCPLLKSFK